MKKALKIILPITALVIAGLFFFKNDLMLWKVTNKYKTDPSSINLYADLPKEIGAAARDEILQIYLEKPDTSEKSLASTIELIAFIRTRLSESSVEDKSPIYKKSFDVLMDIYKQTENEKIRRKVARFIKENDIKAFYNYFEITQRDGLLFYDDNYRMPYGYPEIYNELDTVEKELWCKYVQPKIEANYVAILKADTFKNTLLDWRLLEMYEKSSCNNDRLQLRKMHFAAWSELLANFEKQFFASKNPKEIEDFFILRYASHQMSHEAKNRLEATNFISFFNIKSATGGSKAEVEKKLILYLLDYPIESRVMCLKIVYYICHQYGESMDYTFMTKTRDKEVMTKAKAWLKLVAEKYPELSIEEDWKHQMIMSGYPEEK